VLFTVFYFQAPISYRFYTCNNYKHALHFILYIWKLKAPNGRILLVFLKESKVKQTKKNCIQQETFVTLDEDANVVLLTFKNHFLWLCWVGVHCGIYKSSYNILNISYLNLYISVSKYSWLYCSHFSPCHIQFKVSSFSLYNKMKYNGI
jgi:hypothetical protein